MQGVEGSSPSSSTTAFSARKALDRPFEILAIHNAGDEEDGSPLGEAEQDAVIASP